MKIEYDNLVFNDVADANGTVWYITELDGWDSPATRQASVEPTSRHGNVIAKTLLAPRAMVAKGVVKSTSEVHHWTAWSRLQGVTNNLVTPRAFKVTEDIVREVGAVRAGPVRQKLLGNFAFEFELPLSCPDPLKYPVEPETVTIAAGATQTLANDGNFPTERITVTADAEGIVGLWNDTTPLLPGLLTRLEAPEDATFDFLNRDVRTATGDPIPTILHAGSYWWSLIPGENEINNRGEVAVTIDYYPAWL